LCLSLGMWRWWIERSMGSERKRPRGDYLAPARVLVAGVMFTSRMPRAKLWGSAFGWDVHTS
jgi:hypothetical protein